MKPQVAAACELLGIDPVPLSIVAQQDAEVTKTSPKPGPRGEVADFGCGSGVLTQELSGWARHVTAIDKTRWSRRGRGSLSAKRCGRWRPGGVSRPATPLTFHRDSHDGSGCSS